MAQRRNEFGLTPKEEAFCQTYVAAYGTPEFGNATEAVAKVYNYRRRKDMANQGYLLLNRSDITRRIADLLNVQIAEAKVDAQSQLERDNLMSNFDEGLLWQFDEETGRDMKTQVTKLPKWIRILGSWKSIGGRAIFTIDKEAARNRLNSLVTRKVEFEGKVEQEVNLSDYHIFTDL